MLPTNSHQGSCCRHDIRNVLLPGYGWSWYFSSNTQETRSWQQHHQHVWVVWISYKYVDPIISSNLIQNVVLQENCHHQHYSIALIVMKRNDFHYIWEKHYLILNNCKTVHFNCLPIIWINIVALDLVEQSSQHSTALTVPAKDTKVVGWWRLKLSPGDFTPT